MKLKRTILRIASLLLLLSPIAQLKAEPTPGNPFGNGTQAPPPEIEESDDFLDPGNNFGFQQPSMPPTPVVPDQPSNVPSIPPPSNPPPSRPAFNQPSNLGQPSHTTTVQTPSGKKDKKAPTRLADYLELDSSVKSLEVKNFDLPDKEIKDVVTLISKWTGKNFIIDNKVRGKITIMGPSQVTLQEAYQAFLSALEANNLTTVQAGKFIRIIESADARRAPVKTYAGEYAPKDDQFITRIIQLKYINADEVQREFRDLTTRQGKLFAYEPTNSIIITDTGSNIQRIKELLESLDVKSFETTLHVLRIRNTGAKAISEMLGEIYGDDKSRPGQPRSFRKSALERTRGGGVITKIIPDESTNSLVVLANQAGFEQLKQLVAKLDVKVTDTGRIHVYYCEYAKAEDLAQTLASLAGGGSGGARTSKRNTTASVAPGNSPSPSGSSGPVTAELEGGVKITSDAATNALVVTANSSDYQTIKKVIKKLDIPRLQVFIETAILEISLDSSDKWGMNAALGAPGRLFAGGFIGDGTSLTNAIANLAPGEGATLPIFAGPAFQGSAPLGPNGSTVNVEVNTIMGMINILTKNTNSSVLQTPQIIALDNEKAEFQVIDEIPVVGSTTAATANSGETQNVTTLKSGVVVKLTPHVNAASKTIRLEIEQTIDSLKNSNDVPEKLLKSNKAKTSRITNTSVVVKDRDFLMMGGLISDKLDETETKVPLLGDIPILGWLFKSKSWSTKKTNLVILLHPKIIGSSLTGAETITEALEKRKEFVDEHFSGDDPADKQIKTLKSKMDEQTKRGTSENVFDYRNNNDDDAIDAPKPGDTSELEKKPKTKVIEKGAASEAPTQPLPEQNIPAALPDAPLIAPPSSQEESN